MVLLELTLGEHRVVSFGLQSFRLSHPWFSLLRCAIAAQILLPRVNFRTEV